MGQEVKKKREAEARAARKAQKVIKQATQAAESRSTSADTKPHDSSDSKTSKKSKAPEKMPRAPSSTSTRTSTRSRSTSAAASASLDTGSIKTRSHRLATVAAKTLLQQVLLSEQTDSEEDPHTNFDDEVKIESHGDENVIGDDDDSDDDDSDDDDSESSSDDIVEIMERNLVAPTTQQAIAKVSSGAHGAQKKASKMEVEEDKTSDEEFGASGC